MLRIALDMMGGDYAPEEAVKGAAAYKKNNPGHNVHLLLIGDEEKIKEIITKCPIEGEYSIVHSTQVIDYHDHPTKALKEKPNSSIAIGLQYLAAEKADAFISAGNTGAMMVGALFSIKTIKGVSRPTIGAYMPREDGSVGLLVDAGLNVDCKPENLNQFAILGSLYAEHILGINCPKVGLLNVGEEEGKGDILTQAAYSLLKANDQVSFIGNVEGRDVLVKKADVIVCDGFTGNVVLKLAESVYDIVKRRKIEDEHFERFNFETYGGVPVLGVAKPVIIGHGISGYHAFENMIAKAVRMLEVDFAGKMQSSFAV